MGITAVAAGRFSSSDTSLPLGGANRVQRICVGKTSFQVGQDCREGLLKHEHLGARVRQNVHLFGSRQPPVQRNEYRAEPRAGVKQNEIIGRFRLRIATLSPRPMPSSVFSARAMCSMRSASSR